jgi:hypothetical protein
LKFGFKVTDGPTASINSATVLFDDIQFSADIAVDASVDSVYGPPRCITAPQRFPIVVRVRNSGATAADTGVPVFVKIVRNPPLQDTIMTSSSFPLDIDSYEDVVVGEYYAAVPAQIKIMASTQLQGDENPANDGSVKLVYNCQDSLNAVSPALSSQIKVFPNPNGGKFNIFLGSDVAEPVQLSITNTLGQEVLGQVLPFISSDRLVEIDLTTLPKSVYTLRVISQGKVSINRVITR